MRSYTTQTGTRALLKAGVRMEGLETAVMDPVIDAVAVAYASTSQDVVITSALDGRHTPGSLHYDGHALDFRVWGLSDVPRAATRIEQLLGGAYDVIAERNADGSYSHIHVEYDPDTFDPPDAVAVASSVPPILIIALLSYLAYRYS